MHVSQLIKEHLSTYMYLNISLSVVFSAMHEVLDKLGVKPTINILYAKLVFQKHIKWQASLTEKDSYTLNHCPTGVFYPDSTHLHVKIFCFGQSKKPKAY